jgi:hypothetical protein
MQEIEQRAKVFAAARTELADRIESLRDEQEAIKRRRLQGILNSLVRFTSAHDELRNALGDSREQFDKPKTRILHGVRVGWMKQKGKLKVDDPERVVKLIRRHFSEHADTLIKTTERPVASALGNLSAAELKRLGVSVADDTDAIVIKPVDAAVDKLIDALINDPELEELR